jgi:hypothetical protein
VIREIRMWFWRRRVRRVLEGAACHDVRFIDERRRFGFEVAGELGVRAGYGENDFQNSQLYQPGSRRGLMRAKQEIEYAARDFAFRTVPCLALDGRTPDIGGKLPRDLIRFG